MATRMQRFGTPWMRSFVLALAVVVLVLWPLPAWLTRHPSHDLSAAEQLKATNDVRATLVQALAGLALLGGLFYTARTFWLGAKNSELALQQQLTDRYTKAVEQLGSATLDVRLGGIYALERLAHDSPRDRPTIFEVLSAFARVHSDPVYRLRRHLTELGYRDEGGSDEERRKAERREAERHVAEYDLPVDVQDAVTVLGRLPHHDEIPCRVELSQAYLRDAKLSGDLRGADLSETDLTEADLTGADLTGANVAGVRWSTERTRWPATVSSFVRNNSRKIERKTEPKGESEAESGTKAELWAVSDDTTVSGGPHRGGHPDERVPSGRRYTSGAEPEPRGSSRRQSRRQR